MKSFTFQIGALAPSIAEQIESQGYTVPQAQSIKWEKQKDCILQLWFDDILTDREKDKCMNKLFNNMVKALKKTRADDG
jgi:hypothetical protein